MPSITLVYHDHNLDEVLPAFTQIRTTSITLVEVECKNVLDGLAKLHEELNGVAMPRVHQEAFRNTAGVSFDEAISRITARGDLPVTISC